MILKEYAIEQQPRERLKSKGIDNLNDSKKNLNYLTKKILSI